MTNVIGAASIVAIVAVASIGINDRDTLQTVQADGRGQEFVAALNGEMKTPCEMPWRRTRFSPRQSMFRE